MSSPFETAVAFVFVLVGLSHVLHGRRWASFFEPIFENEGGPFLIAILTLPLGLAIVATHNVWSWDCGILFTLYGWCALIKGTLYLIVPQVPFKVATKRIRTPRHFAYAGIVLMVWGAAIGYDALL